MLCLFYYFVKFYGFLLYIQQKSTKNSNYPIWSLPLKLLSIWIGKGSPGTEQESSGSSTIPRRHFSSAVVPDSRRSQTVPRRDRYGAAKLINIARFLGCFHCNKGRERGKIVCLETKLSWYAAATIKFVMVRSAGGCWMFWSYLP